MHCMRQCNTFLFEEHPSAENVQGIGNIFHEEPFLVKFLQTRLQIATPLTSEAVQSIQMIYPKGKFYVEVK